MQVDPRKIISGLIQRGVPRNAAIAIAGNIAVESGFRTDINEIAPLVEGSRGGYGLPQWTGSRRRQFEAFAGDNASNLDTQLDFLVHELNTTEARARDAIYAAPDAQTAARLVSDRFLRPGIPHMDRRLAETNRLADMPIAAPQQNQPAAQNTLSAQVPQRMEPRLNLPNNQLAVSDFLSKRRFNTLAGV